jgi:hypothetical protein
LTGLFSETAAGVTDTPAVKALVQAYVACRLAIEVLPDLPDDVRAEVSEPVTTLCHAVGPALERIRPGFLDGQELAP